MLKPPLSRGPAPETALLDAWGARSPRVRSDVYRAQHERDVAAVIERAPPRGLIARGGGHSFGDAAQRAGGGVLDTTGLDGVLEFDEREGIVTAQAGMRLGDLMRVSVPRGWLPAALPTTGFVTVGGAIAADIHGRNQHCDGSFADHVVGLRLRTPLDTVTVTRESEPDLFSATAGGMGLTGVVLDATIRLTPIETAWVGVRAQRAACLDDLMAMLDEGSSRYSAGWLDAASRGRSFGRGVVVRGDHVTRAAADAAGGEGAMEFSPVRGVSLPRRLPPLLRGARVRAMNELIYRSAIGRDRVQSLGAFFHVHDRVRSWLRLCGPPGFVEYQFVVPQERDDAIPRVIDRTVREGAEPFLVVLKRFRRSNDRPLSFSQPGWMLALTMLSRPGLASLLLELDEIVAEAGGRVYLAKDARLRPEALAAMYPDLDALARVRDRHDPERVICSDLSARLEI